MAPRRPGLRRTKPKGAQAQVNASKLMRPRRVLSLTLLLLGIASVFGVVLLLQKTDLREVATQAGTNGGFGEREALSESASSEIRALFVPLLDPTLTSEEKDRLLRQEQLDLARLLADAFPHVADAQFLLAMAHQEQGDSVGAIQHLEACLKLQPQHADTHDQLGRIAQETGQHARAVAHFRRAIQQGPRLTGVHYRLGEALKSEGMLREAITELDKNVAIYPQAPDNYALLGDIYLEQQDYAKARAAYEKTVALKPDFARPYYGLATACARLGLADQSARHRRTFSDLEARAREQAKGERAKFRPMEITRKSVAHTHADIARVYNAHQRYGAAELLWQRALLLDPQNVASCFELADLYLRNERADESLTLYQRIVAIQQTNGAALFFIGHIHENAKRFDAAEAAYGRVLEVSPDRPEGYQALARFYLEVRPNLPRAKELASALIELAPSASNFHLLASICEGRNERDSARVAIRQAVALAPRNVQYRQFYERIKETP
ncbi:MAG: tetratricopeptide repeat protein [Planctomycetes bacterium]|nr:tetratricopeptide repeat protein [Planctomycetota bacterium]